MKKLVYLMLLLVLLVGCAAQQPLIKQTSSKHPEGLFRNTNVELVKSKIIEACSSKGVMILEVSDNQIICGKELSGWKAVAARVAVGNKYSSSPQQKVRFVLYQAGNDTKVIVYQWLESQMAFGQVNTQELNNNNQFNDIQKFLFSLGAE